MGLLDILGGLAGGQRGGQTQGGLSPIAIALISLLAGKSMGGGSPGGMGGGLGDILGSLLGGGQPRGMPPGGMPSGGGGLPWNTGGGPTGMPQGGGGGLGDLLGGLLGGAGGGQGGNVLIGGLNDLLRQFDQRGHGALAQSWIGGGENHTISPAELENVLGSERVDSLAEQAGLSRIGLLEGLSQELPGVIDQLTPDGRIPTGEEADKML